MSPKTIEARLRLADELLALVLNEEKTGDGQTVHHAIWTVRDLLRKIRNDAAAEIRAQEGKP